MQLELAEGVDDRVIGVASALELNTISASLAK